MRSLRSKIVSLALALIAVIAPEPMAQRTLRLPRDPTTGRYCSPSLHPVPPPSHFTTGGEVIGYTTIRHYYVLTNLDSASADLVADGHTLVPIGALGPGALAGIDSLVVGLYDVGLSVSAAAADVIEDFVLDGGKLVFLGENNRYFHRSNVAIGGRFGIVYPSFDVGPVVLSDIHEHRITDGPFGIVGLVDGPANAPSGFGSMSSPGPYGASLVDRTSGYSAAVVIEPNALGPGSGVVVAFADINIFLEDYFLPDNRVLWRNTFVYGGRYKVEFDTEDDFVTNLPNGQVIASPARFGRLVSLASSGPNAGAAIFDSSALGPNDPSQDRDLLVGRGKLLILQNSQVQTQTVPGVFDRPNDDQDGGTLTFTFPDPVEPLSIVLVDIDAGNEQASSVSLIDQAARTRVFTVPSRWTEDLLADGPPGWRTLDLSITTPQAGFQSIATAVETPGFDERNVTSIQVHLGSSGAVDDLTFIRYTGPH